MTVVRMAAVRITGTIAADRERETTDVVAMTMTVRDSVETAGEIITAEMGITFLSVLKKHRVALTASSRSRRIPVRGTARKMTGITRPVVTARVPKKR